MRKIVFSFGLDAVLLARQRPIVGLLGVFVVLTGPWASLWPMSAVHEDLAAFVHGGIADPTNPSFLLFVGTTLVGLGRVVFVRRAASKRAASW